jgi:hypothetical protein
MCNLKGKMGGFGNNLPFCPLLMPLGMEVYLIVVANSLGYNYAPNKKSTITKILKFFYYKILP